MNHSSSMSAEHQEESLHHETVAIKQVWNKHSAYQWVYFDENYKKMISHYLGNRLTWPNLEIWGWWYLSHPNSAVIDVSEKALEYNPAKNKECFDLDDLWRWKKLPYKDGSFESATMISVWQYMRFPKDLLRELERVLVPGGELLIINEQWAWLQDENVIKQFSHSAAILKQVQALWYEAHLEEIEVIWHGEWGFKTVIVGMPQMTLFWKATEIRKRASLALTEDERDVEQEERDNKFRKDFVETELKKADYLFGKLKDYPVTEFSLKYRQKFEDFSREYKEETWEDMLLCCLDSAELNLNLAIDDRDIFPEIHANSYKDPVKDKLMQKYNIRACTHHTSLESEIMKQLWWEKPADSSLVNYFIPFLCNTSLNGYTTSLQHRLYENLKKIHPDLDNLIHARKAQRVLGLFTDRKQRKEIDKILAKIKKIKEENIPTSWINHFIYLPYMREIKEMLHSETAYRRRSFSFDD
ncbi:MAG: hypothetical protein ACD_3C00046G0002 [uncultured bacterium (gcode 4)]|uniref:Methyltransferase type 11 domain-containing protein n=1 Tax=uncultured bacterium (gcode 4) TaxID=1234023 RepID=K2GE85_9BACT|nr:MAG: hypothetical protein ACD_3C00046G0002 [uncultured bacterium (gcode 4)]